MCVYAYIYIYIYIYLFITRRSPRSSAPSSTSSRSPSSWSGPSACGPSPGCGFRKGTNWVITNGVTANFMFFDRGAFWVPIGQHMSIVASLFPQSVKHHYFCSDPIGVDPICPQPRLIDPANLFDTLLVWGAGVMVDRGEPLV